MKIARCLLWPAVSITTCLSAPTAQECTLLNKLVSAAGAQSQAVSFCKLFIPPMTTTQTTITTTTSTTAIPTPTLTITSTVTVTPDATTITSTQDLCEPTARKLAREAASDDISGRKAPALPRTDSPSPDLRGRTALSPIANLQILGTSKDKRPSIWSLFAADALVKACSCLGIPGAPLTVTTTSTATAFVAAAQVTTTTTTTSTLPVQTVYTSATTQFQLVTSTNDILYLRAGITTWYFKANNPATYSPQDYYLYNIQGGVLRSSSTDCLTIYGIWGRRPACLPCNLDANLHLQCNTPFYKFSDGGYISTSSDGADNGGAAIEITAIPHCSSG